MKQYVLVETIPEHWHTAEECRIEAESWKNEELNGCIDKVLAAIWNTAKKGGTEISHPVLTSRPLHFYETFQEKMEILGYKVTPPTAPHDSTYNHKFWKFSW